MITFRIIIYRNKFNNKNIKSKSFSFVKKIVSNNVLDICVRKETENWINNKDFI